MISISSLCVTSFNDAPKFADRMTFVLFLSSSRAKGKIPSIQSTPELSQKITQQLWGGF